LDIHLFCLTDTTVSPAYQHDDLHSQATATRYSTVKPFHGLAEPSHHYHDHRFIISLRIQRALFLERKQDFVKTYLDTLKAGLKMMKKRVLLDFVGFGQ
jgi:hypothetical protein